MTQKEVKKFNGQMALIKSAWEQACKRDGIESTSKFVVFSTDNPFAKTHDELMGEFLKLRKDFIETAKFALATEEV
mgnify:CR=1 FL=1